MLRKDELEKLNRLSEQELAKLGGASHVIDERPQFFANKQQATAPTPTQFIFGRSSTFTKGNRSSFIDLSANPFKQITIVNINVTTVYFQQWSDTEDLWLEFDEIAICPCFPGVQVQIPDTVKKLSFRWGRTIAGASLSVSFFLSNGLQINAPPFNPLQVFKGAGWGLGGVPQQLVTLEDASNQSPALLVALADIGSASGPNANVRIRSIEQTIPEGAVRWKSFINGLGTVAGNVIFTPALGQRVFVTDLSFADIPPQATTRAEYYFLAQPPPAGVEWHQLIKAGAGSCGDHFLAGEIEATPGDTFVADVYQAGVAGPWWICARGYRL